MRIETDLGSNNMVRRAERSVSTYRQASTYRPHQGRWNVELLHYRKERRAFQSKLRSGSCGPADDPEVLGVVNSCHT